MLTETSFCTIAVLAFLALIFKKYLNRNKDYWKDRGVVTLKSEINLLQLLSIQATRKDSLSLYYERLGDEKYGGLFELGNPTLFIKDLEVVKQVMIKEFYRFSEHRDYITTDSLLSKSLFFMNVGEWREMRTFLTPTFTSAKIRRMLHHFERSSDQLDEFIHKNCTRVSGGFEMDVLDLTGRWSAEVNGAISFGIQTDALTDVHSEFFKVATNALNGRWLVKFKILSYFPSIGNFFNLQPMDKDLRIFFQGLLGNAVRDHELNTEDKREDFLQILMGAKPENTTNINWNKDLFVQQAFSLFLAGFDGVAGALARVAYLLALHPEEQQKSYNEVNDAMVDGKMSYEALNGLEYLDMVITESVRMFPANEKLERKCTQDYPLPGTDFMIPKGVIVVIPVEQIHNDPRYYPDPHKFVPERFSAENNGSKNQIAFLNFGAGPRNCIGMRLGFVQMKVALSNLINKFELAPLEGATPIGLDMHRHFGLSRFPKNLKLKLIPRS